MASFPLPKTHELHHLINIRMQGKQINYLLTDTVQTDLQRPLSCRIRPTVTSISGCMSFERQLKPKLGGRAIAAKKVKPGTQQFIHTDIAFKQLAAGIESQTTRAWEGQYQNNRLSHKTRCYGQMKTNRRNALAGQAELCVAFAFELLNLN